MFTILYARGQVVQKIVRMTKNQNIIRRPIFVFVVFTSSLYYQFAYDWFWCVGSWAKAPYGRKGDDWLNIWLNPQTIRMFNMTDFIFSQKMAQTLNEQRLIIKGVQWADNLNILNEMQKSIYLVILT